MQPTSMATMPEARENVFREVTSQGMESPPRTGRPDVSCPCPAISYSRYRLSLQQPGEPIQATIHNDRLPLYLQAFSMSAFRLVSFLMARSLLTC
jgi:hypothetical protein